VAQTKISARNEVENMDISVEIPNNLTDVSNGKFVGKNQSGRRNTTRWDWHVSYPINNYDVSLNIGDYVHFGDRLGDVAPRLLRPAPRPRQKPKTQFAQAKGMLEAYQHYFGSTPSQDGYKLIEAPYSGMEHQSAVTYGNLFENGYSGRDWTGVGISPPLRLHIIHESGHEWFRQQYHRRRSRRHVDPRRRTTYLESLYVEYRWGNADAIKYLSVYRPKIHNLRPIVGETRRQRPSRPRISTSKAPLNAQHPAAASSTMDAAWWGNYSTTSISTSKYQNILTEDIVAYCNQHTGMNLTPIFNQYLRHAQIPASSYSSGKRPAWSCTSGAPTKKTSPCPSRVGAADHWQIIRPHEVAVDANALVEDDSPSTPPLLRGREQAIGFARAADQLAAAALGSL